MMAKGAARMPHELGEGERAAKVRRRKIVGILFIAGALGGVGGGLMGFYRDQNDPGLIGPLPPVVAIVATAIMAVTIVVASWAYLRAVDEVERLTNYWSSMFTLYFFLVAYPAWYLLWKGGLVPEPRHEIIFVTVYLVMIAAYFWKKLRS
ncbi:hypothetical protein [Sphingomonas sp. M1-B02]|uniref:hypothetical protein n=1 Tax=Sphingomonas sp. M1-B02 TaxID=3114300 RepID=UPI00223E9A59|nr:hypothetical protein [Sphingomonas sp. S6-11]UZK64861.1 hypothetical protein OKW87_09990 [Sphingomonas sp. S6-11]